MDHQSLVSALCKPGLKIVTEKTANQAHLDHMAMGLAGEAGEILDAVKRHTVYQQPLDIANLLEEMGDVEFYLEGLRQGTGLTRDQCLAHNIEKLTKRYGMQYSDQAAKERKDKQ